MVIDERSLAEVMRMFTYRPPRGEVEREIRFGCFTTRPDGGRPAFRSRVGERTFTNVSERLADRLTPNEHSVVMQYSDTSMRIVRYDDGREEFLIKTRGRIHDVPQLGMRFSSDIETPTDPFRPSVAPSFVRDRNRRRAVFDRYVFDLSAVTSGGSPQFEIEVEFLQPPTNITTLRKDITDIYRIVHPASQTRVISLFNRVLGGNDEACLSFTYPKPQDFSIRTYTTELESGATFGVSLKADGVHAFALIEGSNLHTIVLPDTITTTSLAVAMPLALLEGEELIGPDGKTYFCAFDLLAFNAKGKVNLFLKDTTYKTRYNYLVKIVGQISQKSGAVIAVKYVNFTSISTSVDGWYADIKSFFTAPKYFAVAPTNGAVSFDTDGLVFTPDCQYSDYYTEKIIRKWKPPKKMTIDFMYFRGSLNVATDRGPQPFPPTTTMAKPKLRELRDGQVGEFVYSAKRNRFELLRARADKTDGNYIDVAWKMWNLIQTPLQDSTLVGEDLVLVRKFHNTVKSDLIGRIPTGAIVLDIGGGRGGDLDKYAERNVRTVLFVEPDGEHIAELERRYGVGRKEGRFKFDIHVLQSIAQNSTAVRDFVKQHAPTGVDAVCMFFSLSFFFARDGDLREMWNGIIPSLSPSGVIIGTYPDGDAMATALATGGGVIEGPTYRISTTGQTGVTPEVIIALTDRNNIVGDQIENLVDWKLVVSTLSQYGWTVDTSFAFQDQPYFSASQTMFNSLYRGFAFVRKTLGGGRRETATPLAGDCVRVFESSTPSAVLDCVLYAISGMYRAVLVTGEVDAFIAEFRDSLKSFAKRGHDKLASATGERHTFYRGIVNPDSPLRPGQDIELLCHALDVNIIILDGNRRVTSVNGITSPNPILKYDTTIIVQWPTQMKPVVYLIAEHTTMCGVNEMRKQFASQSEIVHETIRMGRLI